MKISVIIPVYNAEKYIGECLDSLARQKLAKGDELEIIAVDNMSTDGSAEIIREHKGVRLLSCARPGASAARNLGAKQATGDFIWFVDADDYITPGVMAKLIEIAKSGVDLVSFTAERFYEGSEQKNYLTCIKTDEEGWKSRFVRYGLAPWSLLIRKDWFIKNKLNFHEGIIHEDMAIMSAYILYTDKVGYLDEVVYHYRQHENSVLHQKKWNPHCYDIFVALEDLVERFKKKGAFDEYYDDLEWFFIWNLLIDSAKDFRKFKEGREGFRRSREMLKKYFPGWRKNKYLVRHGIKTRIKVLMGWWGI